MFAIECVTSVETVLEKIEVVNSRGAVSPAARATARTVPVTIPPKAVGRMTPSTARHRLTPSAKQPSRNALGTSKRTSWAARATSGNMTMESATEPARPLC